MKESNEIEERQSIDLCKLIDSMNEELNINHNINTQKNLYSDWKNYSISSNEIEINESNIDATDDESRLPEPPANQTLAQWLAGDDLVDEADNDNDETKQINEDDTEINDTADDCNEEQNKSNINDSSQNKNDNLKMNRKRRNSFDSGNDTVDLLTAEMARTGWDVQNGNVVTIGELYLLFCQPNKIILEYSLTIEECKTEPVQQSEVTITTNNAEPEMVNDQPLTTLQKFLVAANITLMNYKKTNTNANNQLSNDSSIGSNTNKSNRKRNTKNSPVNSQLLSNLIQETILNDENKIDKSPEPKKKMNVKNKNTEDKLNSVSSLNNLNQPNKVKPRSTTDDPSKVEEALKELKIRGRHRGPLNKYTYNQNKRFNINGSRPAVLLIRASNLSQAEGIVKLITFEVLTSSFVFKILGTNSKQIVLTANMPQTTSISLGEVNNLNKNGSSVLIPISTSDSTIADSNGTYLQLMPISSTPPVTETTSTITNTTTTSNSNTIENTNPVIESIMPVNEPIINDNSTNAYSQENNILCTSQTLKNPSTDDNWLHEVNQDISLSSLFANCDSTNTELNQKFSTESTTLMSLQTEVGQNDDRYFPIIKS